MADDNVFDAEDQFDADESSEEYASLMLLDMLIDLKVMGKLTAVAVTEIAWWAGRAGGKGAFLQLAKKPKSGNESRHFDNVVHGSQKLQERDSNTAFYHVSAPMHDRRHDERVIGDIPIVLPHEALAKHYLEHQQSYDAKLRSALAADALPPSYSDSPVVLAAPPGAIVLPYCLYVDGVGFAREDTAIGIWLSCVLTGRRWLLVALRKSSVCVCGCRGWCTMYPIFLALSYSLKALADGVHPMRRHDGSEFISEADKVRLATRGSDLPLRGCILAFRGDWLEYADTLGFPRWSHATNPCPLCTATSDTMFDYRGLSLTSLPHTWQKKSWDSYCFAASQCEIVCHFSVDQWRHARSILVFKKSKGGRVLTMDWPEHGLLAGDRLEPSMDVLDVGRGFDASLPKRVVFWRASSASSTKVRNPIFDASTGCTPDRVLGVDWLHALSLGVFRRYTGRLVWSLIDADAWNARASGHHTLKERVQHSVHALSAELFAWYRAEKANHQRHWSQVQNLTVGMLGARDDQQLKIHGSEQNAFVHFANHLIMTHWEKLGALAPVWAACNRSLCDIIATIRNHPLRLPLSAAQLLARSVGVALRHFQDLGVHQLKKEHLVAHLSSGAFCMASPGLFACWEDEHLNQTLKKVAASSHRAVWIYRVLLSAEECLKKYLSRKRNLYQID